MIKIYEIKGVVECSRVFRIGALTVRCNFSGGAVNESGMVPAIHSTNNPITQAVIENSDCFKSGRIRLQSVIQEESDKEEKQEESDKEEKQEDGKPKDGANDFPEVKNSQMAKDVLMSEPYNVSLAELGNKAAILQKADELNINFPNWN